MDHSHDDLNDNIQDTSNEDNDLIENNEDFQSETESQIQDASDSLAEIDNIKQENWDTLDSDERLNTLQNIESQMSEIQNRPSVQISTKDLENYTFGGYDNENNVININQNHLEGEMPVDEMVDTIIHEGRHAYQDYAINNPGFINDPDIIDQWSENLENYLSPREVPLDIYMDQPLESDAWSYASSIRSNLYERKDSNE
ncbi:MAG: hypothetical protein AB2L18_09025 [Anaerolineaceae bacterium]